LGNFVETPQMGNGEIEQKVTKETKRERDLWIEADCRGIG